MGGEERGGDPPHRLVPGRSAEWRSMAGESGQDAP